MIIFQKRNLLFNVISADSKASDIALNITVQAEKVVADATVVTKQISQSMSNPFPKKSVQEGLEDAPLNGMVPDKLEKVLLVDSASAASKAASKLSKQLSKVTAEPSLSTSFDLKSNMINIMTRENHLLEVNSHKEDEESYSNSELLMQGSKTISRPLLGDSAELLVSSEVSTMI
jgi:hypothetical protein